MKILIANPNTSTGVTDRLVASGRLVASAGTKLIPMTAPRGVPYIATRAEAAIGSAVMLEMLAEKRGTFDAAVCAAFGDPGSAAPASCSISRSSAWRRPRCWSPARSAAHSPS